MKQALTKVRRRMRFLRFVHGFLWGLWAGLAACLVLTTISFFVPIEGLWQYLVGMAVICPLLGSLGGALWPITQMRAACRADACGLKERALTALLLSDDDSPMAALQRRDAEASLTALEVKPCMPIRIKRHVWIPILAMTVAVGVLLVIPNPQNDVLRAREQVRKELHAQADEVEQAAEKMAEEGLTKEEKQELRRITGEMARELRSADDKREALEKLDGKQKEMEKLEKKIQQRTANETAKALSAQSGLKGLAEAMESGSASELDSALNALAEKMEGIEAAKELAEQLEKAAEEAPESTQQALSQSAAAAASGNISQSIQALAGACNGSSAGNTGANVSALAKMARSGVAQSGNKAMQMQGSGSGGSGQGKTPGSGAGGGAGMGSSNRDGGYKEGMTPSSQREGTGPITDRVANYEQIYDPTRLGGDGEISHVQGQQGEGETQQMQLGPGMGDLSGMVPYNQVIGEYQDAAAQAMRRTALPASLQDWVTRYFNALVE